MYNPLSHPRETASLKFPSSQVLVTLWNSIERKFKDTDAEAHCYDDPERKQECEIIVKVDVPPLSYSLLRLEGDPLGGLARVVDTGFGLASESEGRRSSRQAKSVVIEADEILDQARYCNNTQSIGNQFLNLSVEACQGGKLTLKI